MIEIENKTDFLPDEKLLKKISSSLTKRDIELIITNNDDIQNINKTYRNIDKPTDVLSFPLQGDKKAPLGSIIISIDYVKEKAKEFNHSQMDEFLLLYVHGLLHLLGYDHEIDNGQMREKEKQIIKKFNLPKSLIVRNDG